MNYDNPNQKGNLGIGMAISYFTHQGCVVSLPLNDNQDYDLIVDIGGDLKKIQVKLTFSTTAKGVYIVYLRTITSSTTGVKKIKLFSEVKCDYLFIGTSDGTMYLIPKNEVTQNGQINLSKDKDKYIVGKVDFNMGR